MLTEKEKDFITDVARFLSGRMKGKGKKEEMHKRKVHYLLKRLGCERFKRLVMRKIRQMGIAGPKFMYRAKLEILRRLMELNDMYRKELVNPHLYDEIDAIPAINFAAYVGADIPDALLVPLDRFSERLPAKDKEEQMDEDSVQEDSVQEDSFQEDSVQEDSSEMEESVEPVEEEITRKRRRERYESDFIDDEDDEDEEYNNSSDESYVPSESISDEDCESDTDEIVPFNSDQMYEGYKLRTRCVRVKG